MKRLGRVLIAFMAIVLCASVMMTPVHATEMTQDGLKISVTTNKSEYGENESITAIVKVENTNDFDVKNVSLEDFAPEGYSFKNGKNSAFVESIKAGETKELRVTFVRGNGPDVWVIILIVLACLAVLGAAAFLFWKLRLKKKPIAMLLAMAMLLSLISGVPMQVSATEAQTAGNVVYVSSAGTGDGSSPSNPLGDAPSVNDYKDTALYRAFEALASTGGTVVVVGVVDLNAEIVTSSNAGTHRHYSLPNNGTNRITVTSKYDNVDYRKTAKAKIILEKPTHLILNGETLWENVDFASIGGSFRMICAMGWNTEFASGINCLAYTSRSNYNSNSSTKDLKCLLNLVGGHRDGEKTYANGTSLKVMSGTWGFIAGGAYGDQGGSNGNVTGDTNIVFGGTAVCMDGIWGGTQAVHYKEGFSWVDGNVNIHITGGTTVGIYGTGNGRFKQENTSTVTIKIDALKNLKQLESVAVAHKTLKAYSSIELDFENYAAKSAVLDLSDYAGDAAAITSKIIDGDGTQFEIKNPTNPQKPSTDNPGVGTNPVEPQEPKPVDGVIYISGDGTGDGSSPDKPLGDKPDAFDYTETALYLAINALKDDGGTIVIVGPIDLHAELIGGAANYANFQMPVHNENHITFTSVWNDVDYRKTKDAKLIIEQPTCIELNGLTTWRDIKFVTIITEGEDDDGPLGSARLISCKGWNTLFDTGIECEGYVGRSNYDAGIQADADNLRAHLSLVGGERFKVAAMDTNITVLSGTYGNILAGTNGDNSNYEDGRIYGSYSGNTHVTFGGDAVVLGGIYGTTRPQDDDDPRNRWSSANGNVSIVINGGTVGGIYGTANGRFLNTTAQIYVKITALKDIEKLHSIMTVAPAVEEEFLDHNNPCASAILDVSSFTGDFDALMAAIKEARDGTEYTIIPPASAIDSINIVKAPESSTYVTGADLELNGMVVEFVCGDTVITLPYMIEYTNFFNLAQPLAVGATEASLKYTCGETSIDVNGTIPINMISSPEIHFVSAEIRNDSQTQEELRFLAEFTNNLVGRVNVSVDVKIGGVEQTLDGQVVYTLGDAAIVDYGFLILPNDVLAYSNELRVNRIGGAAVKPDAEISSTGWIGANSYAAGEGKTLYACTYPDVIDIENYDRNFSAVAYLTFAAGGKTYTTYSEQVETSVEAVAKTISDASTTPEESKTWLQTNVLAHVGSDNPYNADASAAMRDKIVEKMEEMAQVEWTPGSNVNTQGQTNFSTPLYKAGTTYYGLPYNAAYGTADAFKANLQDGVLPKNLTAEVSEFWYKVPGVSCSTSIIGAYTYAINTVGAITGATNMLPVCNNGYIAVGTYKQFDYITTTKEICDLNSPQDMYAAYAQMHKADILAATWTNDSGSVLGHVILAYAEPNVVYNADGTIDGEKSTIKIIEQSSSISDMDGKQTTWPVKDWTFERLYTGGSGNMRFIPVKVAEVERGYCEPVYCVLRNFNTAENLLEVGLMGTIRSNYYIKDVTVTITDASGAVVYEEMSFPSLSQIYSLDSLSDVNTELSLLESGAYTLTVTANVKDADRTMLQLDFTV